MMGKGKRASLLLSRISEWEDNPKGGIVVNTEITLGRF